MQNENTIISDYKHLNNHAKTNIINSWRINYQSWLSNNRFRRITIKYEDLIEKTEQTLRDLIIFVNTICRFNNGVDMKKFDNAVKSTTFDKLQNLENSGKFSESVYSDKTKEKIKFFYLGPKNNWKERLSKELINKMNDYYKDDLEKLNYEI
tara:strand:- start:712 stop:1167 length:456 start_codon:yes stop_codon:yes gene_type:complete